jgi:hypothetical protein
VACLGSGSRKTLRGRTRPFSVVYAPHRRQSAAARAMIELLTKTDETVGSETRQLAMSATRMR